MADREREGCRERKPPIFQYWDAGGPPAYLLERLGSFSSLNPGRDHLLFDRLGAEQLIGEGFGDRELAAFRACAVPSMRADYFRYCALAAHGGVYADVGFRCLEPLDPGLAPEQGGVLVALNPQGTLMNGFFAFAAPRHPLLLLTLEIATANIEQRVAERVQVVTGPWIFTALQVLSVLCARPQPSGHAGEGGIESLSGPFLAEFEKAIPTASGRRAIPQAARPLLATIAERRRVTEAFEGVRVVPAEALAGRLEAPPPDLPYKRADEYWIRWQRQGRSIFS